MVNKGRAHEETRRKEERTMPNYNSNPNQRGIRTHKERTDDKEKDNYYAKINLNALQNAMKSLTPKAFELWIYLSKNQDNHFFWLSKTDFLKWGNIGSSSYYSAFNELKKERYLIEKEEGSNQFDFYEIPKEEKIGITIHKNE
jgi:hypothetical protein